MNQPEYIPDPQFESQVEVPLQSCPEAEQASVRAGGGLDDGSEFKDESQPAFAEVSEELDGLRAELALMFDMPENSSEKPVDNASLDDRFQSFFSGEASPTTADNAETGTDEDEPAATDSEDATAAYMDELLARNRNRTNPVIAANEEPAAESVPHEENTPDRSRTRDTPRHGVDRRLLESATRDSRLTVEIRRSESGETLLDTRLADVSLSGAQLSLTSPVTVGERVSIDFHSDELESRIQTEAEVRWAHLGRDYRWVTGVQFDQPLTNDTLSDLALCGLIERRWSPRSDVKLRGTVKREGRPDVIPVNLQDLSTHGFRLTATENLEPGERILIQLQKRGGTDFRCPAHVRWVAPQGDGITAGCEFLNQDLAAEVTNLIERVSPRRRSRLRLTSVAITLLAALALWVNHASVFERLDAAWKLRDEFSQTAVRLWNSTKAATFPPG